MPQYLYQLAYTAESLAAQVKNPQDRLEVAAKPLLAAVGGKLLGGGYSFGEYDVAIIIEAPDDTAAASVALAVAAVADRERDAAWFLGQAHLDLGWAGVLADVGERLLSDPVKLRLRPKR